MLEDIWGECNTCDGKRSVINEHGVEVLCPDCKGIGEKILSWYGLNKNCLEQK